MSSVGSLRPSTLEQRKPFVADLSESRNRILLSPSKSASVYSTQHDCEKVDQQNTYMKTTARCLFSIFRFYISHAVSCHTFRGTTIANGSHAHCGKCHAAHAALTPNLKDNMYQKCIEWLHQKSFDELIEEEQNLVRKVLLLSDSDVECLKTTKELREKFLLEHEQNALVRVRAGAIACRYIGYSRNLTIEGPIAGNRIDSHLESILRPLEDRLATECAEQSKSPKESLKELMNEYLIALKAIEKRLHDAECAANTLRKAAIPIKASVTSFTVFLETKSENLESEKIIFQNILNNYLESWDNFQSLIGRGVPQSKHEQITSALKASYPLFLMRSIAKTLNTSPLLEQILRVHLENVKKFSDQSSSQPDWDAWEREINLRQNEVKYQKEILLQGADAMYQLSKMEFSVRNQDGIWVSPTRPICLRWLSRCLIDSPNGPPTSRKRKHSPSENTLENKKLQKSLLNKFESCQDKSKAAIEVKMIL